MLQTEFEFTLPKGYLDEEGNLHRKGIMRLSRARDEIAPLKDPRVKSNPAYATMIILARVIVKLGALEIINPS
nr:phage tail assembly protein [Xenococcaceae cyanobacterium MO_188.B29]